MQRSRLGLLLAALAIPLFVSAEIPRTASGHPDFTGTYDVATLTPLERPEAYGDKAYLSKEEADAIRDKRAKDRALASAVSSPERAAPPPGGDGSAGAAGNVGGYNDFWLDFGDEAATLDGRVPTSIITRPMNGRQPERTVAGKARLASFRLLFKENIGRAWWLNEPGPGPYDNMEMRPNAERCLLSFGSTSGPPMLPSGYNNLKRIVQTSTHVMILAEMIHDARIIRLAGAHAPDHVRAWMGDSVGHWEGDTLVVDTTNFGAKPALRGASPSLHVVERFTMADSGDLKYAFTVDDPQSWTASWGGEYPWPATENKVYEYVCHEGNYALGNIMRGARILERDIEQDSASAE
ncbi:MAG: hypothetical protein P8L31_12125 [Pseudomonadales bacterium]|nr:hypothetical protein [Pseudomonadales bacterium]